VVVGRDWSNGIVTAYVPAGILQLTGLGILRLIILSFVIMNSHSKKSNFFHYARVSPGDHLLTKKNQIFSITPESLLATTC